jgi:hypothetical protein
MNAQDVVERFSAGTGWLTTGGWFTVVDGRVSSGQLIYDSAAFDAIVAAS